MWKPRVWNLYCNYILTPSGGEIFEGKVFTSGVCGVTIMRGGAAMEVGLRECCKTIIIGHILIQHDETKSEPQVFYAKVPLDTMRPGAR